MKKSFYSLWTTGRGLYVLLSLLIFGIFVSPFLIAKGFLPDVFIECIFALILVAGVFTTPCGLSVRGGILFVVFSAVAARFLHKLNPANFHIIIADNILAALSLLVFSILIFKHFLLDKAILRYRITGAIAVYLILGALWTRLYEIVYLMNPSAFSPDHQNPFSLIYFSFVTLMTLGYGDIVPVSIAARSLAILEGIVGQLYMVILISSLVSEFSAVSLKSHDYKN